MLTKKRSNLFSRLQINNISHSYRIYLHRIFILPLIALFLHSIAPLSYGLTDEEYIQYQVQMQTILYEEAQTPQAMQTRMQELHKKYKPMSPDWKAYMQKLSQNREKIMEMNKEVQQRLKEKGIGYGRVR